MVLPSVTHAAPCMTVNRHSFPTRTGSACSTMHWRMYVQQLDAPTPSNLVQNHASDPFASDWNKRKSLAIPPCFNFVSDTIVKQDLDPLQVQEWSRRSSKCQKMS